MQTINDIRNRNQQRTENLKQEKEKIKQLFNSKPLYMDFDEKFNQMNNSLLDEKKKKLAEIRDLHKRLSLEQIL